MDASSPTKTPKHGDKHGVSSPRACEERLRRGYLVSEDLDQIGARPPSSLFLRPQLEPQLLIDIVRRGDQKQLAALVVQKLRRIRRREPPPSEEALKASRERRLPLALQSPEPPAAALLRVLDLQDEGTFSLNVQRFLQFPAIARILQLVDEVSVGSAPGLVP